MTEETAVDADKDVDAEQMTHTEEIATPPATETIPAEEQTEDQAGIYFMIQFKDPVSVLYRKVTSTPPPNPLALQAVLQQILDDMRTARELDVTNNIAQAMRQMQSAFQGVPCPHCKAVQDKTTTQRILQGQVAFCAKCHQKIGG